MGSYQIPELDESLAYHEAGHAIAAALCGELWTSVRIMTENMHRLTIDIVALTRFVPRPTRSKANFAFISWAGGWAQARGTGQDLQVVQEENCRMDMETVDEYWCDASEAPHEDEDQWAAELELAWPHIESLAEQLMRDGIVYTRDGERIERDLDELVYEAVEPGDERF